MNFEFDKENRDPVKPKLEEIRLPKGWTRVQLSENFVVFYDYVNRVYSFCPTMDAE